MVGWIFFIFVLLLLLLRSRLICVPGTNIEYEKNLVHQYFLASFSYTNTCMHARMHTQIIVFLLTNMLPILQSAHHFTQSINKHTMHDSIHSLISFSFPFSFGWFFDNDQTSNYSKFTVALSMLSVFLNQSEQRELKFLYAFIRLQLSRVAFHFFLSKITAICSILWLGGSISIGVFVWRFTIQTPNKILSKNSLRIDLTAIPFVSTENRFHNTCRRNVFNGHIFEAKQLWFSTKILWFPKSSPQIRHLNCCNCVLFVDRLWHQYEVNSIKWHKKFNFFFFFRFICSSILDCVSFFHTMRRVHTQQNNGSSSSSSQLHFCCSSFGWKLV